VPRRLPTPGSMTIVERPRNQESRRNFELIIRVRPARITKPRSQIRRSQSRGRPGGSSQVQLPRPIDRQIEATRIFATLARSCPPRDWHGPEAHRSARHTNTQLRSRCQTRCRGQNESLACAHSLMEQADFLRFITNGRTQYSLSQNLHRPMCRVNTVDNALTYAPCHVKRMAIPLTRCECHVSADL
jgi:hypothetical protein